MTARRALPPLTVEAVAAQLEDELGDRAAGLDALISPFSGVHLLAEVLAQVPSLAVQLVQDDDDRLAAQTVIDVMAALWPAQDPPAEWWATPVGRCVARSVGAEDSETVTRSVAAAMLGVHPGTVARLVARGRLDRHPDGGILRASVLQRLASMRGDL